LLYTLVTALVLIGLWKFAAQLATRSSPQILPPRQRRARRRLVALLLARAQLHGLTARIGYSQPLLEVLGVRVRELGQVSNEGFHRVEDVGRVTTQAAGVDRFLDRRIARRHTLHAQVSHMPSSLQPVRAEAPMESRIDRSQVEALCVVVATDVARVWTMSKELNKTPQVDEEGVDGGNP